MALKRLSQKLIFISVPLIVFLTWITWGNVTVLYKEGHARTAVEYNIKMCNGQAGAASFRIELPVSAGHARTAVEYNIKMCNGQAGAASFRIERPVSAGEVPRKEANASKVQQTQTGTLATEITEAKNLTPMKPVIYCITPTGTRLEQKADLTRMSHTLLHVPNLHWILVEDNINKTKLIRNLLRRSRISFTHLNTPTPPELKVASDDVKMQRRVPRGLKQRNDGLAWIRKLSKLPGVVYFADDDNTYDLQVFEEMRYTKKVSVWPVGLVAEQRFEAPIVKNGLVTGWFTFVRPNRTFATDMAGFAVNTRLIIDKPKAEFRNMPGTIEGDFLSQLNVTLADLEPKANNCTEVFVWHTRTERSSLVNEEKLKKKHGHGTNDNIEI